MWTRTRLKSCPKPASREARAPGSSGCPDCRPRDPAPPLGGPRRGHRPRAWLTATGDGTAAAGLSLVLGAAGPNAGAANAAHGGESFKDPPAVRLETPPRARGSEIHPPSAPPLAGRAPLLGSRPRDSTGSRRRPDPRPAPRKLSRWHPRHHLFRPSLPSVRARAAGAASGFFSPRAAIDRHRRRARSLVCAESAFACPSRVRRSPRSGRARPGHARPAVSQPAPRPPGTRTMSGYPLCGAVQWARFASFESCRSGRSQNEDAPTFAGFVFVVQRSARRLLIERLERRCRQRRRHGRRLRRGGRRFGRNRRRIGFRRARRKGRRPGGGTAGAGGGAGGQAGRGGSTGGAGGQSGGGGRGGAGGGCASINQDCVTTRCCAGATCCHSGPPDGGTAMCFLTCGAYVRAPAAHPSRPGGRAGIASASARSIVAVSNSSGNGLTR